MSTVSVNEQNKRLGVIGKKIGMSMIYSPEGKQIPVTLIEIDCLVTNKKNIDRDGYNAVQVGSGKVKNCKKPQLKEFEKNGVTPKRYLKEFRVSNNALVDLGTSIKADHFISGQYVDVQGTTIGRGFSGVMKRHNFRGLEASHGVSITHRSHGSTGMCQDPGKVFKGKKMAGQYGNTVVTMQNLKVIDIDVNNNLLIVKGAVPGHKNAVVYVSDAIKKPLKKSVPFPVKQDVVNS